MVSKIPETLINRLFYGDIRNVKNGYNLFNNDYYDRFLLPVFIAVYMLLRIET